MCEHLSDQILVSHVKVLQILPTSHVPHCQIFSYIILLSLICYIVVYVCIPIVLRVWITSRRRSCCDFALHLGSTWRVHHFHVLWSFMQLHPCRAVLIVIIVLIEIIIVVISLVIEIFIVVFIVHLVKWLKLVLLRVECLLLNSSITSATNLLSLHFCLRIGVLKGVLVWSSSRIWCWHHTRRIETCRCMYDMLISICTVILIIWHFFITIDWSLNGGSRSKCTLWLRYFVSTLEQVSKSLWILHLTDLFVIW